MEDYKTLIQRFSMIPHEEGGHYAEIWRSQTSDLSHIYYLLDREEKAQWHRIASNEIWLFHSGAPLTLYLGGSGERPVAFPETIIIGKDVFHCLIPGGTWQAAEAKDGAVLVSCVVSPGFQKEHWELLSKEKL